MSKVSFSSTHNAQPVVTLANPWCKELVKADTSIRSRTRSNIIMLLCACSLTGRCPM